MNERSIIHSGQISHDLICYVEILSPFNDGPFKNIDYSCINSDCLYSSYEYELYEYFILSLLNML